MKSLMNGSLDELLNYEIYKGNNVIGYNYEEIIQISTLSNQIKEPNFTSINFDEYLELLEEEHSFDNQDDLIIMKIHNKNNQTNGFFTEYVLFYPDGKEKLDLNLCFVPNVKQYKSIPSDICVDFCYIHKFFRNKCKIHHGNKKILIEDIINSTINGSLDDLLLNVIQNNHSLIAENDTEIYKISTLSNQLKIRNSSYINIGECETLLKNENHINQSEELILLLIEHNFTEIKIKIPIIEYIVFSPDGKQKLDLNVCNNITIHHFTELNVNIDELYKYDTKGYYYNDKCFPNSENGIDKIIFDRKNEFNVNNMSLCEKDCDYNGYNFTIQRIDCECKVKKTLISFLNVTIDPDLLLYKFKNFKNIMNIDVIKCYKLLFSKKGIIYNIGSYILLIIILINFILIFLFYLKYEKKFYKEIEALPNKMFNIKTTEKIKSKLKNIKKDKKNIKKHFNNDLNKNNDESINKDKSLKLNLNQLNNSEGKNEIPNLKKKSENKRRIKNEAENLHSRAKKIKKFNKSQKAKDELENKKINIEKNDYELNSLGYNKAKKNDNRNFSQYYYSLLKMNHLFLFTFVIKNDYNSRIIKLCLFLNNISLSLAVNTLFFNDSTMHQIFEDKGNFNFIYQLP